MKSKRRAYAISRKGRDETQRLNAYLTKDAYDKADRMAGPMALSLFIEELVQREYRRREKRVVLQSENACTISGAMQNSTLN